MADWIAIGRGVAVAMTAGLLAGCNTMGSIGQTQTRGYMASEDALAQIQPGSSQEQVQVLLGTPSTVATLDGEVFYYISQRTSRPLAFMKPSIVEQKVLAIYFDKNRRVERIADYGLKDGVVFDFISRKTPTSGTETTFLQRALSAISF